MKQPAAERAAQALRREILSLPDGTHLGLEDDLANRLGVSRPTLRQTARILVGEQLLTVRRGVKGGYYTARPNVESVSQIASTFLLLARAELLDLLRASHALILEAMRTAPDNNNPDLREELEAFLDELRVSEGKSIRACIAEDEKLSAILLRLGANPVIDLFLKIIYTFGTKEANIRIFRDRWDRLEVFRKIRVKQVEAVLSRNVKKSMLIADEVATLVEGWAAEDLAVRDVRAVSSAEQGKRSKIQRARLRASGSQAAE